MDLFIARQPIFDVTRDVIGYELLFRSGLANYFNNADSNEATRQVLLNTFVLFGLNRLTGGKPAFINFTREFLFNDLVRLFPPQSVVVEVLEDVLPDPDVVEACRRLKAAGYTIALDDVVELGKLGELVGLCDIVKIDLRAASLERCREIATALRGSSVRLLAEKVETHEEFKNAASLGLSLFQGYFFAKPELVTRKDVPGNRTQYLRLMRELCAPETDMNAVERVIKQDLSLSYRLLKYVNSPLLGLRAEIGSVRHALTILGQRDFRRWATLATLACAAPDKPSELLEVGLTRARFCETLSSVLAREGDVGEEMFLLGLFSVLDALLDVPIAEIARDAGVPARVKAALLGAPSPMSQLLELSRAYERGQWAELAPRLDALGVEPAVVAQCFVDSLDWARQTFLAQSSAARARPRRPRAAELLRRRCLTKRSSARTRFELVRRAHSFLVWLFAAGLGAVCGCAGESTGTPQRRQQVVNGDDDRRDYFETPSEGARAAMTSSAVALIPRRSIGSDGKLAMGTPRFGEANQLCEGERFAEQPAAAFCSGILVDWDLVLTAGHCVLPFAVWDFVAVPGYYQERPDELAVRPSDVLDVAEIVAVERDPPDSTPRRDYAWLRLARPARAPRSPASVLLNAALLADGDDVTAISTVGGTPLKVDAGAKVRDARAEWRDYLVADTDTNHGSSGGGLFNQRFELLAVMSRGATDFTRTETDCQVSLLSTPLAAEEEFTYASAAVNGLCLRDPERSLCRSECGDVCRSSAPSVIPTGGGCAYVARANASDGFVCLFVTLLATRRNQHSRRRRVISMRIT